jgi:hypothetical protein
MLRGYALRGIAVANRDWMSMQSLERSRNIALFVALLATALALGGALAHALELPNKIQLSREDYFTVQRIYAGWNQLAYLLLVQFTGIVATMIVFRRDAPVFRAALAALAFLVLAQAVFWAFTFPTNVATENWTAQPQNWQDLRARWEYSHLAGAALQVLAMGALIVAALRSRHTTVAGRG